MEPARKIFVDNISISKTARAMVSTVLNTNGKSKRLPIICHNRRYRRAGLTILPVVPWEGPPARGPRSTAKFFYHAVLTFDVTTTTKKVVNFFGEKCTPEKILATRMREGPRLALVWGPRMVNPALRYRLIIRKDQS